MYIKRLKLNNFKNFADNEFEFKKINCISGNNGVGKTNILEAVYYLSFCRSFNGNNDSDIIRYGEDFFSVKGDYQINDTNEDSFIISLKKGERKIVKHGKQAYKKLSEHIGKLPCVVVSPNDHVYITGRSEMRRKFMDMILSQCDNVYMDNLINYNKCLEQRNKLIKTMQLSGVFDSLQTEIWNERLATLGNKIQSARKKFFDEFIIPFKSNYDFVSDKKEDVNVQYKTFEGNLTENLLQSWEKDKVLGYTTKGIHRDDLQFFLNGHEVNHCASQGQQKTFLLALKLAQFEYLQKHKRICPILMLDDIFDKFDFCRVEKILELVGSESIGQVFITDTHPDRVKNFIPEKYKDNSKIINL